MKKTIICDLLNIKYPLIQGGMVWVSGAKLASACSNAGILGVIGAGSMNPELLENHLTKALALTNHSIAVNLPLLYKNIDEQIEVCLNKGIKIFITSAGSPKKFTSYLKDKGCVVIHVTSTPELAKKCEAAGVDAIIAEGFEAGGHNGRDELTTLTLIPQILKAVSIPVIAAGGFATGESILAGLALGVHGIQMGTRFMMSQESSAHKSYKALLKEADFKATQLMMKKHVPVRLYKNQFYQDLLSLEDHCASKEEMITYLGRGRAKKGMLEGDLEQGELEAGQICGLINDIPTVKEIVANLDKEYKKALDNLLLSSPSL